MRNYPEERNYPVKGPLAAARRGGELRFQHLVIRPADGRVISGHTVAEPPV
jgi:hypothetical protein